MSKCQKCFKKDVCGAEAAIECYTNNYRSFEQKVFRVLAKPNIFWSWDCPLCGACDNTIDKCWDCEVEFIVDKDTSTLFLDVMDMD